MQFPFSLKPIRFSSLSANFFAYSELGCVAGTQWLHSRVDVSGYEEYSGVEYRSAGCSEEYSVIE